MATKKMMQGDSYALPFRITINGTTDITPDIVSELELCIGNDDTVEVRKTLSAGGVWYNESLKRWFFRLSQQETFGIDPGTYDVIVRPKFANGADSDVIGIKIGRIMITNTQSEEVI